VVRTLFAAQAGPGRYSVKWDRSDDKGRSIAAGVYLFRLETEAAALSRKVVLVR